MSSETLVFVYNAHSGPLHAVLDLAHKTFSPDTYPCKLCALTFSGVSKRRAWRQFLGERGLPVEFLYRDTLKRKYGVEHEPLPAVFVKDGDQLKLWVTAAEMARCVTLDDLIDLIGSKPPMGPAVPLE